MINCRDILSTMVSVKGVKVFWRDNQVVEVEGRGNMNVYRIYFSYGNSILVLQYEDESIRNLDYDMLANLIKVSN